MRKNVTLFDKKSYWLGSCKKYLFRGVLYYFCVDSHVMVISLFKPSSTFIQFVSIVRLTSGFWRKHKFAKVSSVHMCV